MKRYSLHILVILVFYYACAPKTVPVSKEEKYEEDLSHTIPEVDPYISPVPEKSPLAPASFSEPIMDITLQLDTLLDRIALVNTQIPHFQYTILVHNSNSRQAADSARRNVFRALPDADPKMNFDPPSYKVKVGRFYNKLEAYQTLVKLKEVFPHAVMVPEQVYIK